MKKVLCSIPIHESKKHKQYPYAIQLNKILYSTRLCIGKLWKGWWNTVLLLNEDDQWIVYNAIKWANLFGSVFRTQWFQSCSCELMHTLYYPEKSMLKSINSWSPLSFYQLALNRATLIFIFVTLEFSATHTDNPESGLWAVDGLAKPCRISFSIKLLLREGEGTMRNSGRILSTSDACSVVLIFFWKSVAWPLLASLLPRVHASPDLAHNENWKHVKIIAKKTMYVPAFISHWGGFQIALFYQDRKSASIWLNEDWHMNYILLLCCCSNSHHISHINIISSANK